MQTAVNVENRFSDGEEKILEYVRVHGSVTKNEIAGLLKVSASTAARVVRKMVKANLLKQKGKARNTHYIMEESIIMPIKGKNDIWRRLRSEDAVFARMEVLIDKMLKKYCFLYRGVLRNYL